MRIYWMCLRTLEFSIPELIPLIFLTARRIWKRPFNSFPLGSERTDVRVYAEQLCRITTQFNLLKALPSDGSKVARSDIHKSYWIYLKWLRSKPPEIIKWASGINIFFNFPWVYTHSSIYSTNYRHFGLCTTFQFSNITRVIWKVEVQSMQNDIIAIIF